MRGFANRKSRSYLIIVATLIGFFAIHEIALSQSLQDQIPSNKIVKPLSSS